MKKLGSAIIGYGSIGPIHAEAISNLPQVQLKAVVDLNKEARERANNKYHCQVYEQYDQVLQDSEIQVIHICTPHYLHVPMAIQAIQAGKHVLIEKPVAINLKELADIKQILKLYPNTYAGVIFQNRYNETSIKAKKMIENKEIGEILGIKGILTWYRSEDYYKKSDWRGKWETEGGGVLINQAIHTLDLMQWLGGKIKAIKGSVDIRSLQNIIEVEDTAEATLYFENKYRGIFYATNSYTENSSIELAVHGSQGNITLRDRQLILTKEGQSTIIAKDRGIQKGKPYWGSSHQKQIDDFYQCIIQKKDYSISIEEAGIAIEMIQGIYQSDRTERPYKMQYL